GGFTLAAAEAVCGGAPEGGALPADVVLDAIGSLIDKSLVQRIDAGGSARFGMLETIHEFALEALIAASEVETAQAAHARYFAGLDEWLDPNRLAPGERFNERLWSLEADLGNVRAALETLARIPDGDGLLRLAGGLAIFWHHRGNLEEGRSWLALALDNAPGAAPEDRARGLAGLSLLCWSVSDFVAAEPPGEEALAIARALGHTELTALSLHLLALVASSRAAWDRATGLMAEALPLWRQLGLPSDEAMALIHLARMAYEVGDAGASCRLAHEALGQFRALAHPSGVAAALGMIAALEQERGDFVAAALAYQEGLRLWLDVDRQWSGARRGAGADAALFPGWAGVVDRRFLVQALAGLAGIAAEWRQGAAAAELLGAADRRWAAVGIHPQTRAAAGRQGATAAVQALLDGSTFALRHSAGMQLPLRDAVQLALTLRVAAPDASPALGAGGRSARLTARQVDVLRRLVLGETDRQIAGALFLSSRTVQDHVSRLIAALGVTNRTEAAAVAVRDQLV
ncbi:MAG: LuxR C-terminal-related transcriptional regulator, partial [Thermomicrobiales bacterium]